MKKLIGFLMGTIIGIVCGMTAGVSIIAVKCGSGIQNLKKSAARFQRVAFMMNRWIQIKQEGKEIAKYCRERNCTKIAIYGMDYVGNRLYEEMKDSGIHVAYGIDRSASTKTVDIAVLSYADKFPEVDMVIVTCIYYFEDVKEKLSKRMDCPVVSLEDILYGL